MLVRKENKIINRRRYSKEAKVSGNDLDFATMDLGNIIEI